MRTRLILLLTITACTADRGAPPSLDQEHPGRLAGDAIDSILPMPEYLRRFREGSAEVMALSGEVTSRDTIAARLLRAVAAHDSSAFADLAVSRAEFGWLVFPSHRYSVPPYELDPAIFWLQIQAASERGAARLLEQYGGKTLRFRSVTCTADTVQSISNNVRMWSGCITEFQVDGTTESARLFGTIIERDGVVKVLGYGNEL
ncbi:MAG TPA: hypothetical protein VFN22_00695 [Gemmatimonadales bacterium]|nr:hypothetical protein [Gemmatimonadales bacterium]